MQIMTGIAAKSERALSRRQLAGMGCRLIGLLSLGISFGMEGLSRMNHPQMSKHHEIQKINT